MSILRSFVLGMITERLFCVKTLKMKKMGFPGFKKSHKVHRENLSFIGFLRISVLSVAKYQITMLNPGTAAHPEEHENRGEQHYA